MFSNFFAPELLDSTIYIGLVLFWIGLIVYMSRASKWYVLAAAYPDVSTSEKGITRIFQLAQVNGMIRYGGSLMIQSSPSGLRIKQFIIFRLLHAPLFIPWQDIEKTEEKRKGSIRMLSFFQFAKVPGVTFGVLKTTGDWIEEEKKKYVG